MVRHVDFKERKEEILDLVVESYIDTTKPIGSSYLCSKHKLPYAMCWRIWKKKDF